MSNPEVTFTLDDAVEEVLNLLTGLELAYDPSQDRYRAIARCVNRALRSNALEREWSYYSEVATVGYAQLGHDRISLASDVRPRQINDDAVRLVTSDGVIVEWAYWLPRDALHKYSHYTGLWAAVVRDELVFSRKFHSGEAGLGVQLPVMREPQMFLIPRTPIDPNAELTELPESTRLQELDFVYPDVITLRAAYYYAQTDPVMQPRVQTIEAQYKDLMYQIIERDERNTDTPIQNGWNLGIKSGIGVDPMPHGHPHAG